MIVNKSIYAIRINKLYCMVLFMIKLKINTTCGINKYYKLKMNKTFIGKLRLYWFNFFAIIRDLNK